MILSVDALGWLNRSCVINKTILNNKIADVETKVVFDNRGIEVGMK